MTFAEAMRASIEEIRIRDGRYVVRINGRHIFVSKRRADRCLTATWGWTISEAPTAYPSSGHDH